MSAITSTQVLDIPTDEVMPDPYQPRKTFLQEEIQRLATSIAACGIKNPLRVIRDEQRQVWLILTGESRYRAAKLAGLRTVPCLPVAGELSEADRLADRLTENNVRHDLEPIEESRAIARLKALKGCTSQDLVKEYGFSAASITKAEALLSLPTDVQELIGSGPGQIAPATGYEISRLPDEQGQRELAQAVVTRHLSRDAAADAVRSRIGKRNVAPKAGRITCKIDGISITVSSGEPLSWDDFNAAMDRVRKEAKKLYESGKSVTDLSRLLRAS